MKINFRFITVLLFLAAIFIGCAAGNMTANLPDPQGVVITPPPAGLAPELAAFSGTWEGMWGGTLPSRLIVEKINAKSAQVVYLYGDHPNGAFKAGWNRLQAKVLPGGKLHWGGFTFEMGKDRMSIDGELIDKAGNISEVTMKKVRP